MGFYMVEMIINGSIFLLIPPRVTDLFDLVDLQGKPGKLTLLTLCGRPDFAPEINPIDLI
jgi:hypothetical protein